MLQSHLFLTQRDWWYKFIVILLIVTLLPIGGFASADTGADTGADSALPPGDVDGNGVVDLEDARLVNQYVVGQMDLLPHPENADATEDGEITIEDMLAIAQRATGRSSVVVAGSEYGLPGKIYPGSPVRIEVFERFFPSEVTGGTVRIKSSSTGYDSGDQPLTFEGDGKSLYYHMDISGLVPVSDYTVWVKLIRPEGPEQYRIEPDSSISVSARVFEIPYLAQVQDGYAPALGIPLDFTRTFPQDSAHAPYLGPFGRGWAHSFDVHLEEFTDGRVAFSGPDGFNQWFASNGDGTYSSGPGNYRSLTRDTDGTFQLREKNGFIYRFRPDLHLVWVQIEQVVDIQGNPVTRFRSDFHLDYVQDPAGNRVTCIYNDNGQLTEIRHSCGLSFRLEYNAYGRITKLIDHVGRETKYEYSSDGIHLLKVIDPTGNETNYTYSIGHGEATDHRLTSIAYADGTHVYYTYDSEGRLSSQGRDGGADRMVYSYNADGTTRVTDAAGAMTIINVNAYRQPIKVVDPSGSVTSYEYDSNLNLISMTDPLNRTCTFDYDERGNVIRVTDPLGDQIKLGYEPNFNKISWIQDSLGRITTFSYDSQGDLLTITYPDGSTERSTYGADNQLTSSIDTDSNPTWYSFNNHGQLTSIKDALGHISQFSYDAAGDLQNFTDAKGHVTSYSRDASGRLTQCTYSDSSHEDYEYNAAGKLIGFTNQKGEKISFLYEASGRLEWNIYPSGKKLHFNYDQRGILSSTEVVLGQTATLDSYLEYDLSQRLTLVKVPGKVAPESYDISYAYDAAGNRMFMAYPDGYAVAYEYDAANQLARISDADNETIVSYKYDAAGRRIQKSLGNGAYTIYQYDDMDRLTGLANHASDGNIQSQFKYAYNDAGLRTSMETLEGVYRYTYDDTYQLTGVEYPDGRTVEYTFDEVGNRVSVKDNGEVANYVTNELDQYARVGTDTLQYDLNGNLIKRTLGGNTTTYTWDENDRLVGVDRNDVHIAYRYDYQGRLVAKVIGNQETRYIWDGLDLIAEMDSDGEIVKRYIYGATIDEIIVMTSDGSNYWTQQDVLGSVIGITDDTGAMVATTSYDVYGDVRNGDLGLMPQRFAGMWWDADAGLYYVRARWYEANLGRFCSVDPVGRESLTAAYVYSLNNPINRIDPLGLNSTQNTSQSYTNPFEPLGKQLEPLTKTYEPLYKPFVEIVRDYHESFDKSLHNFTHPTRPTPGWPGDTPAYRMGRELISWLANGVWYPPPEYELLIQLFGFLDWWLDLMDKWASEGESAQETGGQEGGGTCPTFIQLPLDKETSTLPTSHSDVSQEQLAGKITVPTEDCLLRSDIPIFGVAGGNDFKEYRVEYGKGRNPTEWYLIESSTIPQQTCDVGLAQIQLMQGDIDIRGNLATWNTGLKEWIHLPWHPPEDPTDLNGVYTLRLTVFGTDGQKVEDRMVVEVGRVIAQCLPGTAISPDQRVVMRFPEHSLTEAFRVYTILPLSAAGDEIPSAPEGVQLVGPIYSIREPGDRFIKYVSLEFNASKVESKGHNPGQLGILQYDVDKEEWIWLHTQHSVGVDSTTFSTTLNELPTPRAIYALGYDPDNSRSLPQSVYKPVEPLSPVSPGLLINDTFENNMGYWKTSDRFVGAVLDRVKAGPDSSYALKVTNQSYQGSFGTTIVDCPFNVREYPVMSFDYRIGPGVKTDFYLLVNGRWYNLGFTDDPIDFRNRDVNIGNLGRIEGIVADDQWHTASINLYELLRQKNRNTQVDAVTIADWDVTGYMKLEFGHNGTGVAYYIDNFKISAGPSYNSSNVLVVDTFDDSESTNLLGGDSGTFSSPGTDCCQANVVEDTTSANGNHVLEVTFDVTQPGAYGGYWTSLLNIDLGDMREVSLRLHAPEDVPPMLLGLRYRQWVEARVPIQPYLSPPDEDGWRFVVIPLSAFRDLPSLSSMEALFITFESELSSGEGTVLIDDVQFHSRPSSGEVVNFDMHGIEHNLLGGGFNTVEKEAAVISCGYHEDQTTSPPTKAVRISYGGNIGLDYGQGRFSYAFWETGLQGFDARGCQSLVLKIRGEKGGEQPNIWLDDGITRRTLRSKEFAPITTTWQEIRIPLERFTSQGVDISHLEAIQVVFEWEDMSGTIYIAEMRFE